jgi:SAM-dependent methyltransferase
MISGSADYSMLALVLWAFRNENVVPEVHVIDACETPLFLNRWYAERTRVNVETEASDILQWEAAEPFDIICTHSLLGRFNPSARERLIAKWRQLLRPGGSVLTVNRVRPMARADKERFTPEQARAFQEAAVREAEKRRKEVKELFTAGGFVIDRLDLRSSGGGAGAAPSGPAAHGNAEYVHVVAWRGE